jgi:hypothetical protein
MYTMSLCHGTSLLYSPTLHYHPLKFSSYRVIGRVQLTVEGGGQVIKLKVQFVVDESNFLFFFYSVGGSNFKNNRCPFQPG